MPPASVAPAPAVRPAAAVVAPAPAVRTAPAVGAAVRPAVGAPVPGAPVVVAGAVCAELVPALGETERDALLKLAVTGTPFAVALSLVGRFAARRYLHREQRAGRFVRRVVVAGSAAAASTVRANATGCAPGPTRTTGVGYAR